MPSLCSLTNVLRRLLCGQPRLDLVVSVPSLKVKEEPMLTLNITTEQKIDVTLSPKTAAGNTALLDGAPTWTKLFGDSGVVVSEDGLTATLVSSDSPGESQFMISADADLGAGVETIQDVVTLVVGGAKASSLGLVAGDPQLKS